MLNHKTLLALGLAGAVAVPLATDKMPESISNQVGAWMGQDEDEGKQDVLPVPPKDSAKTTDLLEARIDGIPTWDLGEIFNFDVTPSWILSRWSRVSTQVGPLEFQGYRVPLLTGLSRGDLAGTLTYCFNDQQSLQRLTFSGTTDDPSRLIALVTARFGFAAKQSPAPTQHHYEIAWNGRANSRLNVRMAGVIQANNPKRHYTVDLEINLPDVLPSWYVPPDSLAETEKSVRQAEAPAEAQRE